MNSVLTPAVRTTTFAGSQTGKMNAVSVRSVSLKVAPAARRSTRRTVVCQAAAPSSRAGVVRRRQSSVRVHVASGPPPEFSVPRVRWAGGEVDGTPKHPLSPSPLPVDPP